MPDCLFGLYPMHDRQISPFQCKDPGLFIIILFIKIIIIIIIIIPLPV